MSFRFPRVFLRAKSFPAEEVLGPFPSSASVEDFLIVANNYWVGWVHLAIYNWVLKVLSEQGDMKNWVYPTH